MKFTEEQIKILKEYAFSRIPVTITGINSVGQKFESTGCVATQIGEVGIHENRVALYMGQHKQYKSGKCAIYTGFYTDIEEYGKPLYIRHIKVDDEIIYENADYGKIIKHVKNNILRKFPNGRIEDRTTKRLSALIGQPIIRDDGDKAILIEAYKEEKGGKIYIATVDGMFSSSGWRYLEDAKKFRSDENALRELEKYTSKEALYF